MNLPTNAVEFEAFMNEVWRMDCHPSDDGGITLTGSPLYDRWHNAIFTARYCGAVRTGGTVVNGVPSHVYRFPADQGLVSVRITYDGAGLQVGHHKQRTKEESVNGL